MNSKTMGRSVKGQASLEYLMTYGWAILVILVMGLVLWQMGFFNPPPAGHGCSGFSHIVPLDTKLSGNKLTIVISNEAGARLDVKSVSATIGSETKTGTFSGVMRPGRTEEVNITLSNTYTSGEYYRANIVIEYENLVSGISHKSSGDCWGTVE
ncbi:MAG: hypothetical protein DRO89_03640 [Candidatus Altiarchaeales archaeon]|nr:MAG: hypothetical protein DRO89_03640 [Candidatus Altiarchaeales archaeon]